MKFDDVIQQRRSIRGYLNIPVPKALIREVLELAMRAPTSMNTQPWNFYVVSGEVHRLGAARLSPVRRAGLHRGDV